MAVSRLGSAMLPSPDDDLVAQEGDVVYLAVTDDAMDRVDGQPRSDCRPGGH